MGQAWQHRLTVPLLPPNPLRPHRCFEQSSGDAYDALLAQKLAQMGYETSEFRFLWYAYPHVNCFWAALGNVGGRITWVNGGSFNIAVMQHEAGHNLGMPHALAVAPIINTTNGETGASGHRSIYASEAGYHVASWDPDPQS